MRLSRYKLKVQMLSVQTKVQNFMQQVQNKIVTIQEPVELEEQELFSLFHSKVAIKWYKWQPAQNNSDPLRKILFPL